MIKIGVLGMSEGNAHPSSWSAIINGRFDAAAINQLGFPGVSQYLQTNNNLIGIPYAEVTHIWSQHQPLSELIAKSAGISHIVQHPEELIGNVDAVIIARDDPENHRTMATAFLEAKIPVFIDKPLCATKEDLAFFSNAVAAGAFLMSSSSMRYASECRTLKNNLPALGKLELITAVGKKDWIKYGVHMLEAVFYLADDTRAISVSNAGSDGKEIVTINFKSGLKAVVHLFQDISPTFQISAFGSSGWQLADMKDFFGMFRDNIIDFIRSVEEGKARLPFSATRQIMQVLIAASESKENHGITIQL